jgi:single-strand DNA-binding protein
MAVLNRVQLLGHIGLEPKFSITKEGRPLVTVSLTTTESYKKNNSWETVTIWHNLVFFGKLVSFATR